MRSAKRTMALFAGVAIVLALLIVAVRFYRTEPLIGPESPEMLAKRESPDNAFYALVELGEQVPDVPHPLGRSALVAAQKERKPSLIASRMVIRRPDDDPEVLKYLEDTRPLALEAARVLDEQTYYCAPIDSLEDNQRRLESLVSLSRILCGNALYAAKSKRPDEATILSLAALRLGKAVAADGPFENVVAGCEILHDAAVTALSLPWGDYSENQLRSFLDALNATAPSDLDLSTTIDWELRLVEAGLYTSTGEGENGGLLANLQEAALRRFLRKREAMLREVATMSYDDLHQHHVRDRRARMIEREVLPTRLTKYSEEAVEVRARAATHAEGLRAVVALELYRKAHGAYPEALKALMPGILDTFPLDEYSSQPLRYSSKGEAYQLYSVGPSSTDDGGDPKRDVPIPPLSAREFVASLNESNE